MAEMTVEQEKIFIAQELKALSGPEGCCIQTMQCSQAKRNDLRAIAALIEQQAKIIEALKLCWNCRHIEADRCNKHNRLVDFPMREKCDQWQVKEAQ